MRGQFPDEYDLNRQDAKVARKSDSCKFPYPGVPGVLAVDFIFSGVL
jgi:hypothetical protein